MKLSVVIPVFNEEKTVARVIGRVSRVSIPNVAMEIIVVNDASTDKTAIRLKEIKARYPNLKIFTHEINRGKGAAVRTGFREAKGDYLVIQDADLEYDPKYFQVLLNPILEKKTQVVYGTRLKKLPHTRGGLSRTRNMVHFIGNRFLSLVTSLLYGQWITDMETCYKIFPRNFVKKANLVGEGFNFEPEITAKLIKAGYKIIEVPISTNPRGYSEGKKLQTLPEGFRALWTLVKFRFID